MDVICFEANIDCKSKDELGVLAKSFNHMADRINIQIQYLNNLPILYVDFYFNFAIKIDGKWMRLAVRPLPKNIKYDFD